MEPISVDVLNSKNSTFFNQCREAIFDIKITHSLFALPFALFGAGMGIKGRLGETPWSDSTSPWLMWACLLIGCMTTARTFAMLANRIFDSEIDLKNPRISIPIARSLDDDLFIPHFEGMNRRNHGEGSPGVFCYFHPDSSWVYDLSKESL